MHVVLNEHEQDDPAKYPAWCNLSWFHDCKGINGDVEQHYHDLAEIWLWHEGSAEATVHGQAIHMREGVMVYTPPACLHAYRQNVPHSNTGITPRGQARPGHLHVETTGETLEPAMLPFWFAAENNNPRNPATFPRAAFLSSAYSGRYETGTPVWHGRRDSWWAVLVREGRLTIRVDGLALDLLQDKLLIASPKTNVELGAATDSEVAFAIGWP